ncbi:MAG: dihydrofolate synthase [Candidatus Hydrogenedentota bacterium]
MLALLASQGNPHLKYPAVHIGGTNGKGSTGAFLDAMLRAAGYRVGRFTSPPLQHDEEHILVDGTPISPNGFSSLLDSFLPTLAELPDQPTPFELVTAAAFTWFAKERVDCAIIEAGMGGRSDATNVITPTVTVLCPTSIDHEAHLGSGIAAIAHEKAGLIKPEVPVVCAAQPAEAARIFRETADEVDAPLRMANDAFRFAVEGYAFNQRLTYEGELEFNSTPIALAGRFQGENAALAVAAAESMATRFPNLNAEAIRRGLSSAVWPCRFDRVQREPLIVIDCAHNPGGAKALAHSMLPCIVVLAVSNDKDASGITDALRPIAREFIATQYEGTRSMDAAQLQTVCGASLTEPSLEAAINTGVARAEEQKLPLLITGSIFTAAQARRFLKATPLSFR